jgi:hypothetical protein
MKIEHQDPKLEVNSTSTSYVLGGSFGGGAASYTTDGVEKAIKDSGTEWWTTVNWQGSALVFQRVAKSGYRVTVTREAWTLSDDGRTLTKNRRTINMDGVTENTQVYQKQ